MARRSIREFEKALKKQIEAEEAVLQKMEAELAAQRSKIDALKAVLDSDALAKPGGIR